MAQTYSNVISFSEPQNIYPSWWLLSGWPSACRLDATACRTPKKKKATSFSRLGDPILSHDYGNPPMTFPVQKSQQIAWDAPNPMGVPLKSHRISRHSPSDSHWNCASVGRRCDPQQLEGRHLPSSPGAPSVWSCPLKSSWKSRQKTLACFKSLTMVAFMGVSWWWVIFHDDLMVVFHGVEDDVAIW